MKATAPGFCKDELRKTILPFSSFLNLKWTFRRVNCTLARMKCHPLQGRTKYRRTATAVVMSALIILATLVLVPTVGLCQGSSVSREAAPDPRPLNSGASSASQVAKPQSAPNATPFPFLRLVAVLCSGFVISAARLASKFRRFWGLGVFTNPYAVLFLIFGVGLCGVPVTSEGALKAVPFLGSMGPWIADLSGIAVALILPAIRFKSQERAAGDSQVRDLEGGSTSNPILAVIEDAIRDRILQRMQKEVVEACRRYDWGTIKLAAGRALEEEMTIRPLSDEKYAAARQSIENFQSDPDPHLDSRNKYAALIGLLRWCSFNRLRSGLDVAAKETES